MTKQTITDEISEFLSTAVLYDDFSPMLGAAVANQIPVLVTDCINNELIVISVNESFLDLTKRSRQSVLERPLENVLVQSFGPSSLQSILEALLAGEAGQWKVECRPPDGKAFFATAFASSVRNCHSSRHNFISIVRQKEPAGQLWPEREKLEARYDNAPGFIAISDGPAHRITYANSSYKRFVNCSDLVGKTVAEALPKIAEQGFVDLLDEVFKTGVPYHGKDAELILDDSEGDIPQKRYCDFVYQPVHATDGSVSGVFCEGYDVTERHEAQVKLTALTNQVIQLSRLNAMGTMAATLAHELNQPIAAIANYAAAGKLHLKTSMESDRQSAQDAVVAIAEIADRTGQMIKNLRKLTQSGEVQKSVFEITSAITECTQLVEAGAGPGLEIVNLTKHPIMVTANRIQIQQVIINLLKNAWESDPSRDRQKLEIRAVSDECFTTICVRDYGTGVSDPARDSLFTINETTKDEGMGIGLSVSRTIVESHGGRIWLEKSGPKGSEFCFKLPAIACEVEA